MKAEDDDVADADGGVEEEAEGSAVAEGEEDYVQDDEEKPLQPSPDADTHILFSKKGQPTGKKQADPRLFQIFIHFHWLWSSPL